MLFVLLFFLAIDRGDPIERIVECLSSFMLPVFLMSLEESLKLPSKLFSLALLAEQQPPLFKPNSALIWL
jgi:hypothetical protein